MKNITLSLAKATMCILGGALVVGTALLASKALVEKTMTCSIEDLLSDSEAELLETQIKNGAR
ncbi:MAG: hypothetical protein IJ309_01570 [Clostridia bacterium]|nr:hypothetical protein [Clostridia bacterium]